MGESKMLVADAFGHNSLANKNLQERAMMLPIPWSKRPSRAEIVVKHFVEQMVREGRSPSYIRRALTAMQRAVNCAGSYAAASIRV
jgi:hypothetical protein